MERAARRLRGHLRTVGRLAADTLRPPEAPAAEPWRALLRDPLTGDVPVSGWLSRAPHRAATGLSAGPAPGAAAPAANTLAILLHGLGGSADSTYLLRAARAASTLGLGSLRLNSRGADPAAGDIYHAGLTAEIHATVADPALAGFARIVLLGYSLGGHVALRYAAEVEDPRVMAVAAVCSPLDLGAASAAFERPACAPYRAYVLRKLRRIYRQLEHGGARLPNPYAVVRRARTLREWDTVTVVPRFGFHDPDDYYARASAAAVLDRLRIPCLLVAAEEDPMIPPETIRPWAPASGGDAGGPERAGGSQLPVGSHRAETAPLAVGGSGNGPAAAGRRLQVLWQSPAGHVAFALDCDLGLPGPPGLEAQVLGWLSRPA